MIDYLCNVIRSRLVELASHTTNAIRSIKSSTNVTENQPFLGIFNHSWKLVPSLARISASVNQSLKKVQFETFAVLNDNKLFAMETLENALISGSM